MNGLINTEQLVLVHQLKRLIAFNNLSQDGSPLDNHTVFSHSNSDIMDAATTSPPLLLSKL